jgi:hypothetical protein
VNVLKRLVTVVNLAFPSGLSTALSQEHGLALGWRSGSKRAMERDRPYEATLRPPQQSAENLSSPVQIMPAVVTDVSLADVIAGLENADSYARAGCGREAAGLQFSGRTKVRPRNFGHSFERAGTRSRVHPRYDTKCRSGCGMIESAGLLTPRDYRRLVRISQFLPTTERLHYAQDRWFGCRGGCCTGHNCRIGPTR